jgi:hypothetical protein
MTKIVNDFENPKSDNDFLFEPGKQLQINWEAGDAYINLSGQEKYIVGIDVPLTFSERILSGKKGITFMGDVLTGAPQIMRPGDIAYLFKNLESAASENVFVVMIRQDGSYDVLYVSTGDATSSIINIPTIVAAAEELKADKICLVHNHPSGILVPSIQDIEQHKRLKAAFPDTEVMDSIIINLDTGKYAVFNDMLSLIEDRDNTQAHPVTPNIYQFDRQVLYIPSNEKVQIRHVGDIAKFLSVQKRGVVNKLQVIIVDNQNKINRYSFFDPHLSMQTIASQITREVGKYGQSVLIASNNLIPEKLFMRLRDYLLAVGIQLLDVITVQQGADILHNYKSFMEEGLLEPQPEYGRVNETLEVPRHAPGIVNDFEKEIPTKQIHEPMKVDFNLLKREISLPDFLHDHYDWRLEPGSSANNPKMKSPSGDQTIVIKKNHVGAYTYWDVHNDNIRGCTIIDFMQDQLYKETGKLPSLREVGEILQGYVNSGKTVVPTQSVYSISNELLDADAILKIIKNLKPLEDTRFLEGRGISKEILNTPQFRNVFMQKEHIADGNVYNNACVRLVNIDGIRGISQRNSHFKGCLGSRFDTIASSNIDRSRPITMLYIGESMIDSISHFQMNYDPGKNENVLYLSSEGALTDGQINTINKVIEANKIDKVTTIFDNDRAGMLYTFKLTSKIALPAQDDGVNHERLDGQHPEFMAGVRINSVSAVNNDTEKMVYCNIDVLKHRQGDAIEFIDALFPEVILQEFFEPNNMRKVLLEEKKIHEIIIAKYEVSFPYEKEILCNFANNINKVTGKQVKIDRPLANDFNDVLKQKVGVKEPAGDLSLVKQIRGHDRGSRQEMDYR